jgi:hypothetical protein
MFNEPPAAVKFLELKFNVPADAVKMPLSNIILFVIVPVFVTSPRIDVVPLPFIVFVFVPAVNTNVPLFAIVFVVISKFAADVYNRPALLKFADVAFIIALLYTVPSDTLIVPAVMLLFRLTVPVDVKSPAVPVVTVPSVATVTLL